MSTTGLFSTLEGTMSTPGDVQYIGGYHEYIREGGYHEHIGGCSVHWGYHDACGDIMSTLGDIMSTSGFSIEIEMIYQISPPHASDIPLMY